MANTFELTLLLPDRVLLSVQATKVGGDAVNGSFVVLPRHIDFVTVLIPGILSVQKDTAEQIYLAIDQGILVKRGASVWISVLQAIQGDNLEQLDQTVEQEFRQLDERQKQTRTALIQLEANFMRGMTNFGKAYRDV
ncbi:F0F1 ATP synthase subunit epsilon [Vacuolonema iberomarrocanum]|uniref:F0F1 ATP synthase subunit epsilon n=1 Tax=Vacuolonema iberomarrocanum TaxID=3454632 RepID=UPI0019F19279|nr:F0F1 ATP synthase subunit epsilon [filamentous cyanobacterium LEGE 07170]